MFWYQPKCLAHGPIIRFRQTPECHRTSRPTRVLSVKKATTVGFMTLRAEILRDTSVDIPCRSSVPIPSRGQAGRSALHWAASRGNISVVRALLDAGADGRARDGAGKTPLHCAALAGHAPVVEALLDSCGYAAQNLRMHAMAAAVVDGATTGAAAAKRDSDYLSIVDARNSYGSTALHRAAFNGRDSVVVALLKGGASVNVIGRSGRYNIVGSRFSITYCVPQVGGWR